MLDQGTRAAILKLRQQGHSIHGIARVVRVSRSAVRQVIRSGSEAVPVIVRQEKSAPYRDLILELYGRCKGNLVRVHEELMAAGAQLSYQALTAFCRRQGIGNSPKQPVGQYQFPAGSEMQHDTSQHQPKIAEHLRPAQTASLVFGYSSMLFFQFSPSFTRFDCKVFLTDAAQYMQGVCHTCMIDNTHVVVLKGTGRDMVPVPEMAAFAERYGFQFQAHEKGDANRSARVERRFSYIENNFLAGRAFCDWHDANRQAREWCDRVNATYRNELQASPRQLYAAEQPYLKSLPVWVPPVYLLHHRLVDVEGYVSIHTNRYSVPAELIGLSVEVRQTKDCIEIYRGPRLVATHPRVLEPTYRRYQLPEHQWPRGQRPTASEATPHEKLLLAKIPELASYIEALKKHCGGRAVVPLRRLLRLVDDYPRSALLKALQAAAQYGLYDLERVETIILRILSREYFHISPPDGNDEDPNE
jgi:transposase